MRLLPEKTAEGAAMTPIKWRLVWRSRQTGEITLGEWRDRPEHVTRIAANANAAAGGMLSYWVESNRDSRTAP